MISYYVPPLDDTAAPVCDDPPRTVIPPAFYRDEDPPDPPEDDPHWREFPLFESAKGTYLMLAAVVFAVLFATAAHLAILLFM